MTIKQIVEERLRADGFDGLCRADCGCKLDDLMPCHEPGTDCVAGHFMGCTLDGEIIVLPGGVDRLSNDKHEGWAVARTLH